MDPWTVGLVVAVLGFVSAAWYAQARAFARGQAAEARAGAAELVLERERRTRAESLAAERAALLHEAEDLLEAHVRGDEEGSARLDSLRAEVAGLPADAPRGARVAAVRRMLQLAASRRDPGRAPAGPAPGAPAPAGDGRGPDPVV